MFSDLCFMTKKHLISHVYPEVKRKGQDRGIYLYSKISGGGGGNKKFMFGGKKGKQKKLKEKGEKGRTREKCLNRA